MELVNWLDYGSQDLSVYLEELPEDTEDEKLLEMAKKEIKKEGWTLPEKQMIGWETEI